VPSAWSHYSSPHRPALAANSPPNGVQTCSDRVQVNDDTTTVLPPWTDSSLQTIEATASTQQEPAIHDSRTNLNFTKRAFCHALPIVWNNLPQSVISDLSISLSTFKSRLNTELYSCAFLQWRDTCDSSLYELLNMDKNRIIIIIIIMSGSMINSVESKGNSGVSTMTSSKKVPRNDCNNVQQPKCNMAAHTRNSCICWNIIWGQVCLSQIRWKSVTCVKRRNTGATNRIHNAWWKALKLQSLPRILYCRNSDLPDWKCQNNIFTVVFRGHKCADVHERNMWLLLPFYINV